MFENVLILIKLKANFIMNGMNQQQHYTSHTFRRSGATIMASSGASLDSFRRAPTMINAVPSSEQITICFVVVETPAAQNSN